MSYVFLLSHACLNKCLGERWITLLFALLMLFTFNFFIDILGIYLILDGALEMLPTGRRASSRASHLFGGLVSIVLGLFCSWIRQEPWSSSSSWSLSVIVRGGRATRDAQHSQYTYEGLYWLLGLVSLSRSGVPRERCVAWTPP